MRGFLKFVAHQSKYSSQERGSQGKNNINISTRVVQYVTKSDRTLSHALTTFFSRILTPFLKNHVPNPFYFCCDGRVSSSSKPDGLCLVIMQVRLVANGCDCFWLHRFVDHSLFFQRLSLTAGHPFKISVSSVPFPPVKHMLLLPSPFLARYCSGG